MVAREVGSERVSSSTHRVLAALAGDADPDWLALDLCRRTRLGSGRVARILLRMERWGWVESRWEDPGAFRTGRPRHRLYRLTSTGARVARGVAARRPPLQVIWTYAP
jgi:PadR family transcriptional regulator